jgi:hypothetical protein
MVTTSNTKFASFNWLRGVCDPIALDQEVASGATSRADQEVAQQSNVSDNQGDLRVSKKIRQRDLTM